MRNETMSETDAQICCYKRKGDALFPVACLETRYRIVRAKGMRMVLRYIRCAVDVDAETICCRTRSERSVCTTQRNATERWNEDDEIGCDGYGFG
jgi:hypothetical protein